MALTASVGGSQQIPVADNISPVEPARIVHTQHHLTEAAQYMQCLEDLARQRGNTEHDDALWQQLRLSRRTDALPLFHETGMDARAAGTGCSPHVGNQVTPQQRLPER